MNITPTRVFDENEPSVSWGPKSFWIKYIFGKQGLFVLFKGKKHARIEMHPFPDGLKKILPKFWNLL